jgi:metal-dependent amidase/aminoacylase/carboxypeptidase family protein
VADGTVRCLDTEVWRSALGLIDEIAGSIAQAYRVTAKVEYTSSVPPTVNEESSAALIDRAVSAVLGPAAVTETPQSLGGEDFAWYLHQVPGAMARLGTRTPGALITGDLHQPTFDVDERAIGVGVRVLSALPAQDSPGRRADGGPREDSDGR